MLFARQGIDDVLVREVISGVEPQHALEGADRRVLVRAEAQARGVAPHRLDGVVMEEAVGQPEPGLDVGRIRPQEPRIGLARTRPFVVRLLQRAANEGSLALGKPAGEPVGDLGVRPAPRLAGIAPAVGERLLVVRQRERRIAGDREVKQALRRCQVVAVQCLHAFDVRLIRVDARGAQRADVGALRRRDIQDLLRQFAEQRHDRVLHRGFLAHRAKSLPGADVIDLRRHRRAASQLQHVAHHETPRARALCHRHGGVQRQRRRGGRFRSLAHEVRHALVVDHADVLPA